MNFEYDFQSVALGDLNVQNIGDVCLLANNDLGDYYVCRIRTILGWTEIIQFGPFCDIVSPLSATVSYKKFEFKQNKVINEIRDFINKPKANISQVQITEPITAFAFIDRFVSSIKEGEEWLQLTSETDTDE